MDSLNKELVRNLDWLRNKTVTKKSNMAAIYIGFHSNHILLGLFSMKFAVEGM